MLLQRGRAMTAIAVVLDVAFHGGRAVTVSAADIAERLGLARRSLEPLMQVLARGGLLESTRGPRGGYRLGRPARAIQLADITAALAAEPETAEGPGGALQTEVVEKLWDEIDRLVNARFAAMSVEELVRRAEAAGLRRPAAEPISYAI